MTLALGHADALAARRGRIGGGSFRAPSRTYAPPSPLRTTRWRILSLSRRWIWVSFLILLGIEEALVVCLAS